MMSTDRISRQAGWVSVKRLPKGPNGRALWRRCGQEVPKGRLTFCSESCVHEWKITTNPGYVRQCLERRDHGVCQVCGLDCGATRRGIGRLHFRDWQDRARALYPWGIKDPTRSLWEAHHVVAVSRGGGECGLGNYQTLCWRCHRIETRKLRRNKEATHESIVSTG